MAHPYFIWPLRKTTNHNFTVFNINNITNIDEISIKSFTKRSRVVWKVVNLNYTNNFNISTGYIYLERYRNMSIYFYNKSSGSSSRFYLIS